MKKSDLKTGMVIEFENKTFGHVLLGTNNGDIVSNIAGSKEVWFPLINYNENLNKWKGNCKVKRVMSPRNNADYLNIQGDIIWEAHLEIGIICTINGKEVSLKELSKETLLNIRDNS